MNPARVSWADVCSWRVSLWLVLPSGWEREVTHSSHQQNNVVVDFQLPTPLSKKSRGLLVVTNMSRSKLSTSCEKNPLLVGQQKYISSLPTKVAQHFFSNDHVDPETRAKVWAEQADLGERLVEVL